MGKIVKKALASDKDSVADKYVNWAWSQKSKSCLIEMIDQKVKKILVLSLGQDKDSNKEMAPSA